LGNLLRFVDFFGKMINLLFGFFLDLWDIVNCQILIKERFIVVAIRLKFYNERKETCEVKKCREEASVDS